MTKILFNFLSLCDIQALSSNEILHFYCSHWYYNFNHVLSLREKLLKKDWNLEKRVFYPPIQLPFVKMQYWACSFARENLIMIRLLSGLSDYSSLHVNSIMCANALDVIITIICVSHLSDSCKHDHCTKHNHRPLVADCSRNHPREDEN